MLYSVYLKKFTNLHGSGKEHHGSYKEIQRSYKELRRFLTKQASVLPLIEVGSFYSLMLTICILFCTCSSIPDL